MTHKITVLGIDAAFANTGLAIADYSAAPGAGVSPANLSFRYLQLVSTTADKAGRKVVRKNSDDLRRAREIASAVREMVEVYRPAFAIAEVPTGAQSARAAWALGIAVGLLASLQIPLIEVSPREVKEAVGEKFPDKEQIIAWAVGKYPDLNWPRHGKGEKATVTAGKAEHLADAVAAVHAGIKTQEFQRTAAMLASMGHTPSL